MSHVHHPAAPASAADRSGAAQRHLGQRGGQPDDDRRPAGRRLARPLAVAGCAWAALLPTCCLIFSSSMPAGKARTRPMRHRSYGHARVETAATLILGTSLTLIGGGILWESGLRLQHIEHLPAVEMSAFWVAVAVLAKEAALPLPDRGGRAFAFAVDGRQCAAHPGRCGFGIGCRGGYRRRFAGLVVSRFCWRLR